MSKTVALPRATAAGWRITPRASRYQPPDSSETAGPRRRESALIRGPSRASSEGTTSRAPRAAKSEAIAPPAPTE